MWRVWSDQLFHLLWNMKQRSTLRNGARNLLTGPKPIDQDRALSSHSKYDSASKESYCNKELSSTGRLWLDYCAEGATLSNRRLIRKATYSESNCLHQKKLLNVQTIALFKMLLTTSIALCKRLHNILWIAFWGKPVGYAINCPLQKAALYTKISKAHS